MMRVERLVSTAPPRSSYVKPVDVFAQVAEIEREPKRTIRVPRGLRRRDHRRPVRDTRQGVPNLDLMPDGRGILLAEFGSDDRGEAQKPPFDSCQ